jgi:HD-like signal output (HDOD) protein
MSPQSTRSELASLFGKQIAARQLELPMMPGVAAEVLSLVQLESTDAAKLSAVVHRDQTLASNVLRVANSAAYVGQVPVASLQQAVSRLGMQMITDIAMAVSVKSRVFQNPAYADLLAGLWRHSVITGYFTAFIAGLLHDVGKAVLLSNLDRIGAAANVPIEQLSEALHEQHTAAGALLASEWRMPEQLHEAIVFHHQYEKATKFGDLAMTVCLADLLAHLLSPNQLGSLPEDSIVRSHPVLAALNIYPDQLDALLRHADKAIQVAESMA